MTVFEESGTHILPVGVQTGTAVMEGKLTISKSQKHLLFHPATSILGVHITDQLAHIGSDT